MDLYFTDKSFTCLLTIRLLLSAYPNSSNNLCLSWFVAANMYVYFIKICQVHTAVKDAVSHTINKNKNLDKPSFVVELRFPMKQPPAQNIPINKSILNLILIMIVYLLMDGPSCGLSNARWTRNANPVSHYLPSHLRHFVKPQNEPHKKVHEWPSSFKFSSYQSPTVGPIK